MSDGERHLVILPFDVTDCAMRHKRKWQRLSEKKMQAQRYLLPCECEEASLFDLLETYCCSECGQAYYFSFCMGEVAGDYDFWHCNACGTCRESAE